MFRLPSKTRSIEVAAISVFTALSIGGAYALAVIPNVELMSLFVFTAGFLFGVHVGAVVGLFSMLIYTIWNPWGSPIIVISIAQIIGMVTFGVAGGIYGRRWNDKHDITFLNMLEIGITAGFLTLFYDCITNIAYAAAFGLLDALIIVFIMGSIFMIVHTVSNIAFFTIFIGPLVRIADNFEEYLRKSGDKALGDSYENRKS